MNLQSGLSTLFFAGGVVFLVLAAANFWGLNTEPVPIPLDEVTSTPDTTVNLQRLTEQPLTADSALEVKGVDVLSFAVLPANYGCGACSRAVATYIETLGSHPAFRDVSTTATGVIVESNHRKATHFARVQQLEIPTFQRPAVPASVRDTTQGTCFAVMVDPKTRTAFFKVHLNSATAKSDAVFEAARKAYRRHALKLASR